MEVYYDLIMTEYDKDKGYDIHEIERCISALRDYLEETVRYDEETNGGVCDEEIDDILLDCREMLHETLSGVPCAPETPHRGDPLHNPIEVSLDRIEPYRGGDQQRTDEWYARRRGMITASIAHAITKLDLVSGKGIGVLREKILAPPDKSQPTSQPRVGGDDIDQEGLVREFTPPQNPDASTVRGVRYEPVIRRVYEHLNHVKVDEYDCVPHPEYPFLGASPDGIVVEGTTRGRMVEIKCPQPSSIAKDGDRIRPEYWSQMQLQMEVCGLETCDYVRAVVREAPTLKEIQTLVQSLRREYQKNAIVPEVGHADSRVIAAGTIWMDHRGEYHGTDPTERKFRHEDSVHRGFEEDILFIRHYVIFAKDWLTVTVRRNQDWFKGTFLPKAVSAWDEIQRGRQDPDAWAAAHPVNRRTKKESVVFELTKDPSVCLMADD